VRIVPLTPALRNDFLGFFEGEAFADNPPWASCYCQFPQEDHRVVDWNSRTAVQNNALACDRIDAGVTRGYLALLGGDAVGWCSAGPRIGYRFFDDDPVAEAYPNPQATTDAANRQGPMSLYVAAGFAVHREDSETSVVVRKSLA